MIPQDVRETAELQWQISHPIQEYDEARVARLLEQVAQAKRFPSPVQFTVNV